MASSSEKPIHLRPLQDAKTLHEKNWLERRGFAAPLLLFALRPN